MRTEFNKEEFMNRIQSIGAMSLNLDELKKGNLGEWIFVICFSVTFGWLVYGIFALGCIYIKK